MPRVIITKVAADGLAECRFFLMKKNPLAARRAAQTIKKALMRLKMEPKIGRPLDDLPALRELIIPFGESGYIALYRYEAEADLLYVLAFRHQKEAGYLPELVCHDASGEFLF